MPALVLVLSSSASSVSVTSKELPACPTPLLLYLFTYRHVGQFHQDTLLPFGCSQCPLMRDLLLPSAFLVMWLHSIPYLCWSIFLLLLPLIINGCLSKSFIFFWFVVLIFFPLGPTRCLAACLPATTNSPFPWQPLAAWKWGRNAPVTLVMTYYWYHNALHVTFDFPCSCSGYSVMQGHMAVSIFFKKGSLHSELLCEKFNWHVYLKCGVFFRWPCFDFNFFFCCETFCCSC